MTSLVDKLHLIGTVSNFCPVSCLHELLIGIVAKNVLLALQWEAFLFRTFLDLNNARAIVRSIEEKTFTQLRRPEEVIEEQPWERIDVRNIDHIRTRQQAGKKKSKGKKKSREEEEKKRKEEDGKRAAKRKAEEEQRLRNWEESWKKKLDAQEELDNVRCCRGEGLFLKPRTQSNIWISVVQDKMIQDVQISFKHAPVPKPKPPPLPRLRTIETPDTVSVEKKTSKKNVKASRKRDGKKKK